MSDDDGVQTAISAKLLELLAVATRPGNQHWFVRVASAPGWLVAAGVSHGLDLAGFHFAVNTSAVRHVFKHHGDPVQERRRGNLPVTPEDLLALPDILRNPDLAVMGLESRRAEPMIAHVRSKDHASTIALLEARSGRKHLALQTMWEVPGAIDASRLRATLNLDARSDPQDTFEVVVRPSRGKLGA